MKTLENKILMNLSSLKSFENLEIKSVVCLLYLDDEIFFIRRSENMPSHKGDIAFVGGYLKEQESFYDGALREFQEELSISTEVLSFKGYLPYVTTSNSMKVAVCVFKLNCEKENFLKRIQSNGEWSDCFFISSKVLGEKQNWTYANLIRNFVKEKIYFCNIAAPNKNIWGMTGSILMSIFKH